MNEHERVHPALGNEPRGNDGLAKCGSGRQDSNFVPQHVAGCGLLLAPKLTLKLHFQLTAVAAFVANDHANTQVGQRLADVIEAAARKSDVMRKILGARDDAWLVVCRQSHRLRLVELGVLERSEPEQSVSKPRMQLLLGDVDLIAKNEFQRHWQITDDRGFSSTRRRRGPRLCFFIVLRWQPDAENAASSFSILDNLFDL